MTKKKDKISEAMGSLLPISSKSDDKLPVEKTKEIQKNIQNFEENNEEIKKDINFAKDNIKKVIEQGMELIPDMIRLTREMESAKMYDSAAGFMKAIVEINKNLIDLNTDKKKEKTKSTEIKKSPETETEKPSVQNNNFYIGTTEDLLDMVKNKKSNDGDGVIDGDFNDINSDD